MNVFKRINLFVLLSFFVSSVSMATPFDDAIGYIKSIFTLEYLNGDKGEHRNSSLVEKITNHPDRALMTVAVYGLSLFVAKKLFDAADKAGIFNEVPAPLDRTRDRRTARPVPVYADPVQPAPGIPNRPNRPNNPNRQQQRPVNQPVNNPAPNAPVANPLNGQQLHILGLNLPGFFHMQSHTPYDGVHNSCGVHATYNMARVETHVFGRHLNDQEFRQVQQAVYPGLGGRGASNRDVARMAQQLHLSPPTLLLGRNSDGAKVATSAAAFNRVNGPRVAHFLCQVPGHWISISVARNAQGEQAMYLYDNMNGHARSHEQMRQHVEAIYNRFF